MFIAEKVNGMDGQKKIKVGYVCESNPFADRTSWSGLNYKIRESIENAGYEVVWIDCRPNGKIAKLCKLWNEWLHGKTTMFEHTRFFFRLRAWSLDRQLIEASDVLFFPRGAQTINFLRVDKPVIYYSDATFRLLCGYYWKPLTRWQFATGNTLEAGAIVKSKINIRASHWAADSVARDYGFAPEHTYVLRFGANLDEADMTPVEPYTGQGRLNILFSGVDWERKGARIAIEATGKLIERGIDARIYVVGIARFPEEYLRLPYVENVGYLNKSVPEQYRHYIETVRRCHIFVLPTKAECAGIVFGECSAFGIPIYTYDTGGIADYVFNGENGYRLPLTAGADEFADKILQTLDADTQRQLHAGCLHAYRERLNWQAWSRGFRELMEKEF